MVEAWRKSEPGEQSSIASENKIQPVVNLRPLKFIDMKGTLYKFAPMFKNLPLRFLLFIASLMISGQASGQGILNTEKYDQNLKKPLFPLRHLRL